MAKIKPSFECWDKSIKFTGDSVSLIIILLLVVISVALTMDVAFAGEVVFEDSFDTQPSEYWILGRDNIDVSGGIGRFRGVAIADLNIPLVDWELELRGKFTSAADTWGKISLENAGTGGPKLATPRHPFTQAPPDVERAMIAAWSGRISVTYALSYCWWPTPDMSGIRNDFKFHDFKLECRGGMLNFWCDGIRLLELSDVLFSSEVMSRLRVEAGEDIYLDWIRLTMIPASYVPPKTYDERRRHWLDLTDEWQKRVADRINSIDWTNDPVYGTQVTEDAATITVRRPTTEIVFSKKTCLIANCRLRSTAFTELSLPNLVVVDETGRRYEQRYAGDGRMLTKDSRDKLFLKGDFTPRTHQGSPLAATVNVTYEVRKISGMIFLDYTLTPSWPNPLLRNITVEANLGPGSDDLNLFHSSSIGYPGPGTNLTYVRGAQLEAVKPAIERTVCNGPRSYVTWTNGNVGFQMMYADGNNGLRDLPVASQFDPESDEPQFFTAKVERRGRKTVSFTPWNQLKDGPRALVGEFIIRLGIGMLPPRKYRPHNETLTWGGHAWHDFPQSISEPWDEELVRQTAEQGVTLEMQGINQALICPTNIKRATDLFHKYGMKFLQYQESFTPVHHDVVTSGMVTQEEFLAHFKTVDGITSGNINTPEMRKMLITSAYATMKELGTDGIYMDSIYPKLQDESSRLRGECDFSETARMLLDSFDPPKYYIAHAWLEYTPAVQGCADFAFPGEHAGDQNLDALRPVELEFGHNSMLFGAEILPGNFRTYNLESLRIFRQFYLYHVGGFVNYWPWLTKQPWPMPFKETSYFKNFQLRNYSPVEMENSHKFFDPLVIFDGEEAHHPFDSDYSNYVTGSPRGVTTVVYTKGDRWLVTVTNEPQTMSTATIRLNLSTFHSSPGPVVVFDCANKALVPSRTEGTDLVIPNLSVKPAPQVLLITRKPAEPTVLWHSTTVWSVDSVNFYKNTGEMRVSVLGAPNCHGQLWVYDSACERLTSVELEIQQDGRAKTTVRLMR